MTCSSVRPIYKYSENTKQNKTKQGGGKKSKPKTRMEKPTPGEVWLVQRQMTQELWVLALAWPWDSSAHWPGRFPALGLSFLTCQMGGWARRARCRTVGHMQAAGFSEASTSLSLGSLPCDVLRRT